LRPRHRKFRQTGLDVDVNVAALPVEVDDAAFTLKLNHFHKPVSAPKSGGLEHLDYFALVNHRFLLGSAKLLVLEFSAFIRPALRATPIFHAMAAVVLSTEFAFHRKLHIHIAISASAEHMKEAVCGKFRNPP
jgi:hypothetical protein